MKHLPASHWRIKAVVNNMNKVMERKIVKTNQKKVATQERNNS